MTRRLHTIGLAVLFVALATYGCTSWLRDAAANAAKDAQEAARCAKENAPPDTPEVKFATAKAKDAEKFAQIAADAGKDAQKYKDDAQAKVKAAEDELAQAQAEYQEAQKDLPTKADYEEAKKRQGAAQQYVGFRDARKQAEAEAGGGIAIQTLLAKEKAGVPMTEEEIVNLKSWSAANIGYETLGLTFASDERDDPDGLLRTTTDKLNDMDAKRSAAETKRQAVEERKQKLEKAKADADFVTARAGQLEASRVEGAAAKADEAADAAAHFAAKIPACRAKMHDLRKEAFGGTIRPAGIDMYGGKIPKPGAKGPAGPSAGPGGGGGGPEGP